MNILMVGGLVPWHPAAGGGQVIAYNLAQALARSGHRVDYVASAPKHLQRQVNWGQIVYIPEREKRWGLLSPARRSMRDSKIGQYDIVHVHAATDTLAYFAGYAARRTRFKECRLALGIYTPQVYGFPRALDEAYWMYLCHAADVVFTLSNFSKHNVGQAYHVPLSKITVMYGGVDNSFFTPAKTNTETPYRLLCCGRLAGRVQGRRQQKGIDILLRAMPMILTHHQVKLDIVGSGPLLEKFRAMAHELGIGDHVQFPGFVEYDEMPQRYSAADLFILPSRRESFGLVLAEAMAAGLPVVATQVGAIPELVQHGETGMLIPPEDPAALAAAVNYLLRHPREMKQMGIEGRKRTREHFTWAKVAERVLASYTGSVNAEEVNNVQI